MHAHVCLRVWKKVLLQNGLGLKGLQSREGQGGTNCATKWMVEKPVFRFSCNVFISYILFPKMQILFRELGKRSAVFPREVDRYKLDIFPNQPFYMTHIYENDLAWDLGSEVGARILRHPFCFCWFAGFLLDQT